MPKASCPTMDMSILLESQKGHVDLDIPEIFKPNAWGMTSSARLLWLLFYACHACHSVIARSLRRRAQCHSLTATCDLLISTSEPDGLHFLPAGLPFRVIESTMGHGVHKKLKGYPISVACKSNPTLHNSTEIFHVTQVTSTTLYLDESYSANGMGIAKTILSSFTTAKNG